MTSPLSAPIASPAPRPRANGLPRWQLRTVALSAGALVVTGLCWQAALLRRAEGDLPGPYDPWLARSHAAAAMAGLFALGVVSALHIGRGWALARRRLSGVLICALFAALAGSGFWLSYLVSEGARPLVGQVHTGLGVLAFGLGLVHRRAAREVTPRTS